VPSCPLSSLSASSFRIWHPPFDLIFQATPESLFQLSTACYHSSLSSLPSFPFSHHEWDELASGQERQDQKPAERRSAHRTKGKRGGGRRGEERRGGER
jgi:hypothetical protein